MPYAGGNFSIVNTFVPGSTILSSSVNANFADIATNGLSYAVIKNGTQTLTADIPFAGYGPTGIGRITSQSVTTLPSATTTNVLGAGTMFVAISGTTTITSLGTGANTFKFVYFTGALLLTHNATSLILPSGANITTAAGDTMIVQSDASSNVRVMSYQKADGTAIVSTTSPIPSGTVMLFVQTAAPTGWTKLTTQNDKALRIVSGTASTGGTNSFSTVFGQTTTGSYTLLAADIPSHTHTQNSHNHTQDAHTHNINVPTGSGSSATVTAGATGNFTATAAASSTTATNQAATATNQNTGGGGSHSHTMDMRVQYVDVIQASKD